MSDNDALHIPFPKEDVFAVVVSVYLLHIFDPCDSLEGCPEHRSGVAGCSVCHRNTVEANAGGALLSTYFIKERLRLGLDSPEPWKKAAAALSLWAGMLVKWDGPAIEVSAPAG